MSSLFDVPEPVPSFDTFWSCYPRHVGKAAALKAWTKLDPSAVLAAAMIVAVEAQKSTNWAKREMEHIPHASTWLNGERWKDNIEDCAKADAVAPLRVEIATCVGHLCELCEIQHEFDCPDPVACGLSRKLPCPGWMREFRLRRES